MGRRIRIRGAVQGVGFRPFVFRLAAEMRVTGWVRNAVDGVDIYAEAPAQTLEAFVRRLQNEAPAASEIVGLDVKSVDPHGSDSFEIVGSTSAERPTARITPDLPLCDDCIRELRDPADRRSAYAYINCTNCGPRYSIIHELPYDRPRTTMRNWTMCAACEAEYVDPHDRRYHAQPIACPVCGPTYRLAEPDGTQSAAGLAAIRGAAESIAQGRVCAIKGIGGFHLACDARNATAVGLLRSRKFRKEKPFAVMVRDLESALEFVELSPAEQELLETPARPIVVAQARRLLDGVAPNSTDLGVMLPYAPLHVLLFDAGCPPALVMTSGNRSSEPIAYVDADAFERLNGIADVFLVGERPIARRVDDSVVQVGPKGPVVLRRSRGYAPAPVAALPIDRPVLALGADLKNAVTLVVDGNAYVSQHIGDLEHFDALSAFEETVDDLLAMYRIREDELLVVHDAHPEFRSTRKSSQWGVEHRSVQHHRAHVTSVLAEKGAFDRRVVGLALDGTGYGDDGTIWGGEVFIGSVREGFQRADHLRAAVLPGGDAAARHPVQAAAGFLAGIDDLPALERPPFSFPPRYRQARALLRREVRTFPTTSVGRLFDTAAALLGFTRAITFEGQAAKWLEQLARASDSDRVYPFEDLDFGELLSTLIFDVVDGARREDAARSFHLGVARGFAAAALERCRTESVDTVVLSGGVFQNQLLTAQLIDMLESQGKTVWTNERVPPNDGGISLGQAALASVSG